MFYLADLDARLRRAQQSGQCVDDVVGTVLRSRRAGERIGVSGVAGEPTPAKTGTAEPTAKARRVEIFVMGKQTPIVGWDDPGTSRK